MMTEEQFDAQYTHIEDQRQAKQEAVDGWHDQELAKLFHTSKWTQQRIADKVGKSQQWVCVRLRFGRFLEFTTSGSKVRIPANLTERAFRKYWEATDKQPKENKRFEAVVKLMTEGGVVDKKEERSTEDSRTLIIDATKDGFKSREELMEITGLPKKKLANALRDMKAQSRYVLRDNNGTRGREKFQAFRSEGVVCLVTLQDKLEPILKALEAQGKCDSMAEYAPPIILAEVQRLRKLLKDLVLKKKEEEEKSCK